MNKLLLDRIQQRLKDKEVRFSMRDGIIRFGMNVGDVVGKLDMVIHILDDAYVTYAILSSKAKPECLPTISEYLHRANSGLLFGNFELDYTDGEISYKVVTNCEDANSLSNKVIDRSVILPCVMFEKYGSDIIKLMVQVGNPEELIAETEKA